MTTPRMAVRIIEYLQKCALNFIMLNLGLAMALCAPLTAQADDDASLSFRNQISGRVVEISLVEDLFVHLDTDGDGLGDIWAKIEAKKSQLVDELGRSISSALVTVGKILILIQYEFEDGYYEVIQAVVKEGDFEGSSELSGYILVAFPFGNSTFISLDFNSDGVGDLFVQVNLNGLIMDTQGNFLRPDRLRAGELLRIISYTRNNEGFVIAWHVVVGEGDIISALLSSVSGTVVERYELNSFLFLIVNNDERSEFFASNTQEGNSQVSVRINAQTRIHNEQGQSLRWEMVRIGVHVEVVNYKFIEGYVEAEEMLVTN